MRKCIDCKSDKDESLFWKSKGKPIIYCINCSKIRNKLLHEKNKIERNKKQKEKYYENREKRSSSRKNKNLGKSNLILMSDILQHELRLNKNI